MSLAGRFINSIALPKRIRPSGDPDKVGMWGHWSNFVTRRPWIAIALAALILIPLILPVLRLRLGQENIGQTPKSTMERRAYDLMARGFGPGFNGPMLVAIALVPKAQADPAVAAQEKQATDLQNELKAEQKQGNQMADELKSGQASAERQQAVLEKKQASLNQQAAALKAQQSSLQAQQASLQAQANRLGAEANQLTNEKNRLEAEARALAGRAKGEAETLIRVGAQIQGLERLISGTSDPARLKLLNARLARLETQQAATKKQLANDEVAAKSLKRQAERLPPRAARLEAQKASLQSQAAALQRQAATLQQQANVLQQQGAALQQQANALQKQADALQEQKAELDALQAKAADQQKQLKQLQKELTPVLTKAGGNDLATDPRLVKLQDALIKTKGDKLVAPPKISKSANDAVINVIPATAPSSVATAHLVKHLRNKVIPDNSDKGVSAFVGGSTAGNVDLAAEIGSRLPLVIATILLLSMLVLLVAFRSLLISLQAAVTNFLTAMAAFGILTATFQWGWGISLVGIDTTASTVPIASYVPLMMFAVLFGLSMDYQVFLLSSVEHHRAQGESDRDSVRLGLKASARVIAAAALIMISVFSSFVLNGDPVVKQFGVGLASAVALAAAMVLMLAPAVLTILGKWAWWMPSLLGKIVPSVDIEGANISTTPRDPVPAETR